MTIKEQSMFWIFHLTIEMKHLGTIFHQLSVSWLFSGCYVQKHIISYFLSVVFVHVNGVILRSFGNSVGVTVQEHIYFYLL